MPAALVRIVFRPVALLLLPVLALSLFATPLFAQEFGAYESRFDVQETRKEVERVLRKIDNEDWSEDEDTEGMAWLLENDFLSPYSYRIYGGRISRTIDTTVVRVEGGAGDVQVLSRVLEQENVLQAGAATLEDREARTLEPKSIWIGQGMNLVAPWLGVLHSSWNSPRLTTGQTWFRFLGYFLVDAFMVAAGGTNFFQESFDASKNGGAIAAGLAIPRMIGAWQSFNMIRGHNRMAEFKYTFYLD